MALHDQLIARGRWYYTVAIATCGLLAWVPFLHAYSRLKDTGLLRPAGFYGAGAIISMTLMSVSPTDAEGTPEGPLSTVAAFLALALMVGACVQLGSVRRKVYLGQYVSAPIPGMDPAVAGALAAREYRDRARELATNDPLLARDLRIGRPDLQRHYYDGGLIDLNNAPLNSLVSGLEISPEAAQRIVTQRALFAEGFSSVEEAIVVADQGATDAQRLRDRGLVLPR